MKPCERQDRPTVPIVLIIKRYARRVVYLSADGVRPAMQRQISPVHQFHAELERAVQRSGLNWVFLHPASFASNNLSWAPQIREGVVREAFGSRVRALIHEADIAAVAVHALTREVAIDRAAREA